MHRPLSLDTKLDVQRVSELCLVKQESRDGQLPRNCHHTTSDLNSWLASNLHVFDSITTKDPKVSMLLANLPKDAMIRLKYVKRKPEGANLSNEPNKNSPAQPSRLPKFAQKDHTNSTKDTRCYKKPTYSSPEKIPEKYQAARKLLKFAKRAPKAQVQSSTSQSPEKNNIIQNLYFKNQSYFYSNKIELRTLIRSIYYQGQQIEQLKDFLLPTFKKIQSNQCYFETIFEEAKNFSETVKTYAARKISKLLLLEESFTFPGGFEELLHSPLFAEDIRTLISKQRSSYRFKSFSSASRQYIKIIDLLYQHYKHLEQVNIEIEKLTHIYLNNYLSEGSSIDYDTFNFHSRMFVACVYNDRIIHEFILFIYNTFKSNTFYMNKYSKICEKIFEIFENFDQNHQTIPTNPSVQSTPANNQGTYGNQRSNMQEANYPSSRPGPDPADPLCRKVSVQPSRNQEDSTSSQIQHDVARDEILSQQDTFGADPEVKEKKTKKKKKKSKKNKSKAQPVNEVVEQKLDNPPVEVFPSINENSAMVLKDIAILEAMFQRIDSRFEVICERRLSVLFEPNDVNFFISLIAQ
jgi:hypothetical protein